MRPFTHISSPCSNCSLKALVDIGFQQTVITTTVCSESGEQPRGPRQVETMLNGEKTEYGGEAPAELHVGGILVRKRCLAAQILTYGVDVIIVIDIVERLGGVCIGKDVRSPGARSTEQSVWHP